MAPRTGSFLKYYDIPLFLKQSYPYKTEDTIKQFTPTLSTHIAQGMQLLSTVTHYKIRQKFTAKIIEIRVSPTTQSLTKRKKGERENEKGVGQTTIAENADK